MPAQMNVQKFVIAKRLLATAITMISLRVSKIAPKNAMNPVAMTLKPPHKEENI